MNYGNVLPVTGAAGILIAGRVIGLDDVIAAAIAIVLAGVALYRYGSRIDRGRTTLALGLGAFAAGIAVLGHVGGLSWPYAAAAGLLAAILALAGVARLTQRAAARRGVA